MTSAIDPDPLAALRAGDPAAQERFYREHASSVLRWVTRLGGPLVQPEDVAQDVFTTALRTVGSFRGDASERTWLFAITRNVVRNARRRAALRHFIGLDTIAEPSATEPDPSRDLEAAQTRLAVRRALGRLKDAFREVIVLVDLEEHTAGEAAELLGVPEGTVHSRLHHGRKAFAAALAREGLQR